MHSGSAGSRCQRAWTVPWLQPWERRQWQAAGLVKVYPTEVEVKPPEVSTTRVSPTMVNRLNEYRNTAKHYHDRGFRSLMPLQTEDTIRVWSKDRWQPAQLLPQDAQPKEPRSYKIHIPPGTILRRNRHALLKTREGEIFRQTLMLTMVR